MIAAVLVLTKKKTLENTEQRGKRKREIRLTTHQMIDGGQVELEPDELLEVGDGHGGGARQVALRRRRRPGKTSTMINFFFYQQAG